MTPTTSTPTTRIFRDTPPPRNSTPHRGAGRRPQFSAEDVVRITLDLGIDAFSIAAVARELGVTTAAVYRRFPSHKALLEHCLDRILAEIPPLTEDLPWQDSLNRAADEWWTLCLHYPALPRVVANYRDPISRFITVPFASYGRQLVNAGFTPQRSHFAASLLMSALDQVSRIPAEGQGGMSREMLRHRAVAIIVNGIAKGGEEWNSIRDRSSDK